MKKLGEFNSCVQGLQSIDKCIHSINIFDSRTFCFLIYCSMNFNCFSKALSLNCENIKKINALHDVAALLYQLPAMH